MSALVNHWNNNWQGRVQYVSQSFSAKPKYNAPLIENLSIHMYIDPNPLCKMKLEKLWSILIIHMKSF